MSLEGSLKTVPLPEVLHLLADTSKSGELYVAGHGTGGRFWFDGGRYTGFEVGRCDQPVDALFELLRIAEGDFVFGAGASRPDSVHTGDELDHRDIRPVLEQAQSRLQEWVDIVAVVPSLDHQVVLAADPGRDDVQLDRAQWAMVVAVGEGRRVQDVLDARGLPEFDGCKAVKGLVDAGLATVVDSAAGARESSVDSAAAAASGQDDEVARPDEVEAAATGRLRLLGAELDQGQAESTAAGASEPAPPTETDDDTEDADASPASSQPVFHTTARQALSALIEGIANDPEAAADPYASDERTEVDHGEPVSADAADGLADRGPWTSQELAGLDQVGGWRDETEGAAEAPSSEVADEVAEGPEPINRGLLLKFLSSVRS